MPSWIQSAGRVALSLGLAVLGLGAPRLQALQTGAALAQTSTTIHLPVVAKSGWFSSGFTFLAYGDSRAGSDCSGNAVHRDLVARMKNVSAALAFHLGDMIVGYNANTNWTQRGACPDTASSGSFSELVAPLQNKGPASGLPMFLFPVVGNHDDNWGSAWYPDPYDDTICDVFDMPALVPNHTQQPYFLDQTARVTHYTDDQFRSLACSASDESIYPTYMYYSFTHRNAHFVVMRLNSDYHNLLECYNGCNDPTNYDAFYYRHQYDWVRADLAAAQADPAIDHVFVFIHAPIFTTSDGHYANASWQILAEEFSNNDKVRMVFSGHNHVYERSVPIVVSPSSPTGVRDDVNGIVYVTTGGGGSPLHGFRAANPLIPVRESVYHFVQIDVIGAQITLRAIKQDGTLLDTITR